MHARTVEQVRTWDSRPFAGGLGTLSDLAAATHTGAVVAEDTWLLMLNGRVVGVFEGSLSDFEASGTAYSAPHDSVPLLFAMQERTGDTRATYFTEDTPLTEVDQTLTDGNFTGYVELSENVLSGDYYLVYYGGTRRSVAFVGESERLVTGEEAFELAVDEVGLYEVVDVSMAITEIPEPAEPEEPDPEPAAAPDPEPADQPEASAEEVTAADSEPEPAADPEPESTDRSEEPAADPEPEPATATQTAVTEADADADDTTADAEPAAESESATDDRASGSTATSADQAPARAETATADATERPASAESTTDAELDRLFRAEAEWRRTRAIPSLDPDQTEPHEADTAGAQATDSGAGSRPAESQATRSRSAERTDRGSVKPPSGSGGQASGRVAKLEQAVAERDDRIETLERRLAEAERRNESLESELESLREERSDLATELEALRDERDALEARVAELEAGGADPAQGMAPGAALSGTNLFVRYQSKGEPTLDALDDTADRSAINANLQLEHHTQFETADVEVDGQPFRQFLEGTGPFRFVAWLLREFPYDLLDTGSDAKLAALFEAIPAVDRVEFDGAVVVDPEAGRERDFDVVMRDRMGNPLVVAAHNETRDPVRGEELDRLLEGAREVADVADSLAGAFYVTASFFEPAALESAEAAAASGGLFSRQEKASYVKSDGGNGFHVGLVEDRSEAFHVTVPEL